MNLAPLPAALELRIPPQKESTPTPRVTHLPAPLPRTHTALTLCGQCCAVGRQPRTGWGASPGPLPREKIPSAARIGTRSVSMPSPPTSSPSRLPLLPPPPAVPWHITQALTLSSAPRQGAGCSPLAMASPAGLRGRLCSAAAGQGWVQHAAACPASPGANPPSYGFLSCSPLGAGSQDPVGNVGSSDGPAALCCLIPSTPWRGTRGLPGQAAHSCNPPVITPSVSPAKQQLAARRAHPTPHHQHRHPPRQPTPDWSGAPALWHLGTAQQAPELGLSAESQAERGRAPQQSSRTAKGSGPAPAVLTKGAGLCKSPWAGS